MAGICLVSPAQAHSPQTDVGGFYVGFAHPFMMPSHLLAMLAVSLLLGLRWPASLEKAIGFFAAGFPAGLVAAWTILPPGTEILPLLVMAVAAAGLAALFPGRLKNVIIGVAAICGFFVGIGSRPDDGSFNALAFTITGSAFGAMLAVILFTSLITALREKVSAAWLTIALRVVAAWLAAIAAMLAALVSTGIG